MTRSEGDGLKEATFEAMDVGEELGPMDLLVDDHFIKRHAFTVDDYAAHYFAPSGAFTERVLSPAALAPDLLRLLNTRYDPNTEVGLHQKEELWLRSPVRLGEQVRMSGRFTDKYVKRDKGYIVTEAEARSLDDGRVLLRHIAVEIAEVAQGTALGSGQAREGSSRRVEGVLPDGAPVVQEIDRETPLGAVLIGPSKVVHQAQMSVFSNVEAFWRNIHTDRAVATAAGMPGTLAQGLMESLYLSEFGYGAFGKGWYSEGWLSTLFVNPVMAGDQLELRAVVVGRTEESDGLRVELESWCEKEGGIKTAVGWMSCLVQQ